MLETLKQLDEQILYRLRCVDFLPPELVVERVTDGRVFVRGGGPNGWIAELTIDAFDDDSRWWLTGVEWAWSADGARQDLSSEDRIHIMAALNPRLLPQPIPDEKEEGEAKVVDAPLVRLYNYLRESLLKTLADVQNIFPSPTNYR